MKIMKKSLLMMAVLFLMFETNAQTLPIGPKPSNAPCTTLMSKPLFPVAVETTHPRSVAHNDLT